MYSRTLLSATLLVAGSLLYSPIQMMAQQIGMTTPAVSLGESYYENFGVNFGFQWGGPNSRSRGFFQQGSANSAIPPFGGYDPAGDASFGFTRRSGNGSFTLGMRMGKGFGRTLSGAAPSVVVPNGGIGSVASGFNQPFVTGVIPVAGYRSPQRYPAGMIPVYQPRYPSFDYANYLAQRSIERASFAPEQPSDTIERSTPMTTATRGDQSVAEIKRERAARLAGEAIQKNAQLEAYVAAAEKAEAEGNLQLARLKVRRAIKLAVGQQRYDLKVKLDDLISRSRKPKKQLP